MAERMCVPPRVRRYEIGQMLSFATVLDPVGCVAVATDEDNGLAMLLRCPGETLAQLLARLDQAIDKALTEDIYTDEINSPSRRS